MKDPQDIVARRIAGLLDQGRELPASVLARLQKARQNALERHRGEQRLGLAGSWQWSETSWLSRALLPLVLVLGIAIASQSWLQMNQEAQRQAAEIAEIDAAMLSSDLPLDAYLDRDFSAWANSSSH